MRPTYVEIDLAAIRHNIKQIRSLISPETKLVAAVKANAYGHGAYQISRTVLQAGANGLAVALPEEGAELRAMGITAPIISLGLALPTQADFIVEHNLIPAVSTPENIQALAKAAQSQGKRAQILLKVDTGMGRIGITPESTPRFLELIREHPFLELAGIFTHLATADAQDKGYANIQLDRFRKVIESISSQNLTYISAANSATTIDLPSGHFNTVRPGIVIYGLQPSDEMHHFLNFRPAMSLKSRIVYIKQVTAGTPISYGCTHTTASPTYIATLPLGYADGYSRLLSNKASVLIGGRRRPLVGRICMDQIMVDLGPVPDASIGDEAVLFGRQGNAEITVTELANLIGTINYELVCGISQRVPRIYLHEE